MTDSGPKRVSVLSRRDTQTQNFKDNMGTQCVLFNTSGAPSGYEYGGMN